MLLLPSSAAYRHLWRHYSSTDFRLRSQRHWEPQRHTALETKSNVLSFKTKSRDPLRHRVAPLEEDPYMLRLVSHSISVFVVQFFAALLLRRCYVWAMSHLSSLLFWVAQIMLPLRCGWKRRMPAAGMHGQSPSRTLFMSKMRKV